MTLGKFIAETEHIHKNKSTKSKERRKRKIKAGVSYMVGLGEKIKLINP